MKYKLMELGAFMLTIIPYAMVTKNGNGKITVSFSRIAEVLLGAAIIGLVVGYLSTAIIQSTLAVEIDHIQEVMIEIKKRIIAFHGE